MTELSDYLNLDKRSFYENTLPMGLAYIEPEGSKINLRESDRPYAHLNEAQKMHSTINNYLSSKEGQNFQNYLQEQGLEFMVLHGYGTADLGDDNAVAALMTDGKEGIIVSNYDGKTFEERITQMAQQYNISDEAMTEYIIAHELLHATGNEKNQEAFTEHWVESKLADYFTECSKKAESQEEMVKYESLASIAEERAEYVLQEGETIEGKLSLYNSSSSYNLR